MALTLESCQERIAHRLMDYLPKLHPDARVIEAVHYSCLNGGKRLRPLLVYLTGYIFETSFERLDPLAVALELIHCYSLIHDDLPSMDNDDLRRSKPTCHIVFGEGRAILAGDGLLTLAFELLSTTDYFSHLPASLNLEIIKLVTRAAGLNGMVQGQDLDLASEGKSLNLEQLIHIHRSKTGALLKACILSSALMSQQNEPAILNALNEFGESLGLAYQIQDDIIDTTSRTQTLGKTANKDKASDKCTFVSLLGLTGAKEQVMYYYNKAIESLDMFGERANPLREISAFIVNRDN